VKKKIGKEEGKILAISPVKLFLPPPKEVQITEVPLTFLLFKVA